MKTSGFNEDVKPASWRRWEENPARHATLTDMISPKPAPVHDYADYQDFYLQLADAECSEAVAVGIIAIVCIALMKITLELDMFAGTIGLLFISLIAAGWGLKSLRNWIKFRRKAA